MSRRAITPLLLIAVLAVISSCATTGRTAHYTGDLVQHFNAEDAYIAFRIDSGMEFNVILQNLDSNSVVDIEMPDVGNLQLIRIPEGRYALVGLRASDFGLLTGRRDYYAGIPISMMHVIDARPGSIVYIGELEVTVSKVTTPLTSGGSVTFVWDPSTVEDRLLSLYAGVEHARIFPLGAR